MGLISRVSSRTYRSVTKPQNEGQGRAQRILYHWSQNPDHHGAKPQVVPTTDLRSRLGGRQVAILEVSIVLPKDQQEGWRGCRVQRGRREAPRLRQELWYLDPIRQSKYQREHVPRVP